MSGGLDSSVAAAILKDRGYEVVGVSMNLMTCSNMDGPGCCSAKDREDARRVCEQLEISHYVIDARARFHESVIMPFVKDYISGRTPSPCILCNRHIKFSMLMEEAEKIGAQFVATGHYARVVERDGRYFLMRALDRIKDQSYFLFGMTKRELARTIFPLGDTTKKEARLIAKERGLPTHVKPESQEICFVPDGDYAGFIEASAGLDIRGHGNFVDAKGTIVGRHRGIHAYTIGQRRGLGFGIGKRQYVVRIIPDRNEVVLGTSDDLLRSRIIVRDVSWINGSIPGPGEVAVRIRSTHHGEIATIKPLDDGSVLVKFDKPVSAAAPGQAAVFYSGDIVQGGGWIE